MTFPNDSLSQKVCMYLSKIQKSSQFARTLRRKKLCNRKNFKSKQDDGLIGTDLNLMTKTLKAKGKSYHLVEKWRYQPQNVSMGRIVLKVFH